MNSRPEDHDQQETETLGTNLTTLEAITRGELDMAIATAKANPRSVTKFMRECLELATLNDTIAAECVYALPRREREADGSYTEKTIEGPSARLAEIVVSSWGNCRAGARIIDEGREFVTAQGVFHDLERNTAITYEVKRRIVNKRGDRFSADMIGVTANAACSIALRNAVFKGVPKAIWAGIYDSCRKVIAGDSKTLASRRDQALDLLQKLGVSRERVLAKLGIAGTQDIGIDEIVMLRGFHNAIKEGEVSVEEAFPPTTVQGAPSGAKGTARVKEMLRPGAGEQAFDSVAAEASLAKAKTVAQLDEAWKTVKRSAPRGEVPLNVEARYREHREALEQEQRE